MVEFRKITYFQDLEDIYDSKTFEESVFRELPQHLGCKWDELLFCFEYNCSDAEALHELFYLLSGSAETVTNLDEEATIYSLDETKFALLHHNGEMAICIRNKDLEFIKNFN